MSGSLERVLMFGDVAENFLNVTVSEFMALNAEQRTAIAHSKLWNRYKVFLKVERYLFLHSTLILTHFKSNSRSTCD